MQDKDETSAEIPAPVAAPRPKAATGATRRAERLAVELRANLGRRKQRARKVAAAEREIAGAAGGGPDGGDGATGGLRPDPSK